MKKLIALIAGATLATAVFAQSSQIAVINVAKILQNSSRVRMINSAIRSKFQPQQARLAAQDKMIRHDMAKLKRNGSVMSASQKKNLQETISKDRQDFAKNAALFQRTLATARNKAMKEVVDSLNMQIKNVANKRGYSMVLFSQAVAYPGNAPDITREVSLNFNRQK